MLNIEKYYVREIGEGLSGAAETSPVTGSLYNWLILLV
jgi:hypothetical protein